MNRKLLHFQISLYFCLAVVGAFALNGCYSFSGASVPEHWTSISLPLFDDESNYGQPTLREQLTNALISKIQQDNTLQLADRKNASVELTGAILSVAADKPIAVAQGVQASRLQIDIQVKARLVDNAKKKEVWTKTFTGSGYYDAGSATAREAGIREAVEKVADNLLLEIVSGW